MRVGVVIQARTGSTRLPGKVLLPLGGKTVLDQVIARAKLIKGVDQVLVATTSLKQDWPIADIAKKNDLDCFCGSEENVLDRYYWAAKYTKLDTIVRITADCPLLDPEVSSQVVDKFKKSSVYDYVSNVHPSTWPDGLDTEAFSALALEKAHFKAATDYDKEHVTPYLWRRPSRFILGNIWNTKDLSHHRWTLDTTEDYAWIKSVYDTIKSPLHMRDVLAHQPHTLTRK